MLGPDLTHFGSRGMVAAGALPNDAGPLEAWLNDPQTIKPGNHMPIVALRPEDRRDLVASWRRSNDRHDGSDHASRTS